MGTKDKLIRNVDDALLGELVRQTHLPQGVLVNQGLALLLRQGELAQAPGRKPGVLASMSRSRVARPGGTSRELLDEIKGNR